MAKRHAPGDWKKLCLELQHMMKHLGRHAMTPDILAQVSCPVRIAVGDRDQMVSIAESEHAFKAFGTASLLVMPSTPHLFEKVNHDYLAFEIKRFLS
jgi:pimeloyl-ACP methyl ester carboxylesterase